MWKKYLKTVFLTVLFLIQLKVSYAQKVIESKNKQIPDAATNDSKIPYIYPDPAETPLQRENRMQWWHQAKFGMFIHFGLYAIPADGEWHMRAHHETIAQYSKLAAKFNPVKFDADVWMQIAHEAGMKYMVITSKHHDGFAMFKSKASSYNIVDATPFKRDILEELSKACPRHDVRFGVYYSGMADWGHPGGGAGEPKWDVAQNGDTDDYIDNIVIPQVHELMTNYGPIGELWFDNDGSRGMTHERANRIFKEVKLQPKVIVDPRLGSGDFDTEEQHISPIPPVRDWEACLTLNGQGSWGYKNSPVKSTRAVLVKMADVFCRGGNVLLNVGPDPQGIIPADNVRCLHEIGAWFKINGDAVYGTHAGPFDFLTWGGSTRKNNTVYLFVKTWPKDGQLHIPATLPVKKAYLLAKPKASLKYEQKNDRLTINVPEVAPDSIISVIALELSGEPEHIKSLALNKPCISSFNDKSASLAVDNNPATRWKPGKDAGECWLQVDLGTTQSVGVMRVGLNFSDIKKFTLEYEENAEWKIAYQGVNMSRDEFTAVFSPVRAKKIRLHILESSGDLSVSSFELFKPEY